MRRGGGGWGLFNLYFFNILYKYFHFRVFDPVRAAITSKDYNQVKIIGLPIFLGGGGGWPWGVGVNYEIRNWAGGRGI